MTEKTETRGWLAVGASLFVGSLAIEQILGLTIDGFRTGLAVANYEWVASVALILMATFFVPIYLTSRVASLPEFLQKRFGEGARVYLSLITLITNVLIRISVPLYAGSILLDYLTGQSMVVCVTALGILTMLYTKVKNDRLAEILNAGAVAVIVAGSAVVSYVTYFKASGWFNLKQGLGPGMTTLVRPMGDTEMPWLGLLIGVPVLAISYWCTDAMVLQRILKARSVPDARCGALLAGFLKLVPIFVFVLAGMSGRIVFPNIETKHVFPILIESVFPFSIQIAIFASLIVVLVSSVSLTLKSTEEMFRAKDLESLGIEKWMGAIYLMFGIVWVPIVTRQESMFQYLQQVQAVLSPPMVATFLLGVFWKRANHAGALFALVLGLFAGMAMFFYEPMPFLICAGVNFGFSVLVLVVVSLMTSPPPEAHLRSLTWMGIRKIPSS